MYVYILYIRVCVCVYAQAGAMESAEKVGNSNLKSETSEENAMGITGRMIAMEITGKMNGIGVWKHSPRTRPTRGCRARTRPRQKRVVSVAWPSMGV